MRFLDPRFRLVAALIDDPTCSAKVRDVARQQAEQIAEQCGMSFADALRHAGVKLRPDAALPYVAQPAAADDPVAAEPDEALDDDSIGIADVISEPGDRADSAGIELKPAAPNVVKCHHRSDDSDDAPGGGQIEAALKADPGRSDRDVARECGVSPTTVGKLRKALGLGKAVRTVTRGGVAYEMDMRSRS